MQIDKLKGRSLVVLGCGYIGSYVAISALRYGMKVTALTRNPERASLLKKSGIQVFEGLLESSDWHSLIDPDQDYVLNTVSAADRSVAGYRVSYCEGSHSIKSWSRKGEIGLYVYTSSTGVYPQNDGSLVDELAQLDDASERSGLLIEAEHLAREVNAKSHYILRLAGIIGPGRTKPEAY